MRNTRTKRGQVSLEFIFSVAFSLAFLAITMLVYYQGQLDAASFSEAADAKRVCNAIASQITKTAVAGNGASALLFLPVAKNYTINISAPNRMLSVSYGNAVAGCSFATNNVSNGVSSSFGFVPSYLNGTPNNTIRNVNGSVQIA